MPPQPIDPALNVFAIGTMLLSIAACMNVIHMRRKGPVLPFEPRRPVPWGPVGGILAGMSLLNAAYAAFHDAAAADDDGWSQTLRPSTLIIGMMEQLFIVAGLLVIIAVFTKATLRDLGWPANIHQFARDVAIGAAACLAALAPVHMLQITLMHVFFPEMKSGHPLIKMVVDAPPDPWILLLTGVAAVVVAPICEEVTFRLLFQGWLERWEDRRLGWRTESTEMQITNIDAETTNEEGSPPADPSFVIRHSSFEPEPPQRGISGLPYGWFPIIVSAVAFGLAHFGYGPEPVPLFVLGLVLGFLYQRTHRIIPGIVVHSLFNLFTMIVLWRMVYHRG